MRPPVQTQFFRVTFCWAAISFAFRTKIRSCNRFDTSSARSMRFGSLRFSFCSSSTPPPNVATRYADAPASVYPFATLDGTNTQEHGERTGLLTPSSAVPAPESSGFFAPSVRLWPGAWLIQDPKGEYARRLTTVRSTRSPKPEACHGQHYPTRSVFPESERSWES